jgi:hypothetical protein
MVGSIELKVAFVGMSVWRVRDSDGGCTMLLKWRMASFYFSRYDGALWAS